ncbi:MAG: class I SAM-dependent RNA methyltransferase [Syntrophales bacterium]
MLKPGDCVQTRIGDVAFGGDGVGRVDDLVLFVPFTVDGDDVEVRITEAKRRFSRGKLLRVLKPSLHRTLPPCPVYTRCGGCRLQHIAYPHQLAIKQRQVEEAFRRIATIAAPPVAGVIPSPESYGYRGKAEFHVAGGRGGQRLGLMALASNDVVAVENCPICADSLNRNYAALRDRLARGELRDAQERLVIWADEPGEPLAEAGTGHGDAPDVVRIVREKRLIVPYQGFFQANRFLIAELVAQVVRCCALAGGETVVDAYAGVGLFSLFLGAKAGRLFGIEGDREAVRCAEINLRREGLGEAEFFCGDVAAVLEREFVRPGTKVDVAVLDPPRDGCGPDVVEKTAGLGPERVVYVSCNPATQARDILKFSEYGYRVESLQPLDMFPQTAHIEVVALLMRR